MNMKTSKLELRNTSYYPDNEVWPLIKAAYASVDQSRRPDQEMPRIIVKMTNCSAAYRGSAHWTEWDSRGLKWERIIVRIGAPDIYPQKIRYPKWKSDMPVYECRNYRECIVMVTAHEMQHCLGASGTYEGEFVCELAASDAIDYFRKNQSEIASEIWARMTRAQERSKAAAQRLAESKRPDVRFAKKLQQAREALTTWQRKSKLAANKVKKYARAVARHEKAIQQCEIDQNLPHPTESSEREVATSKAIS